MTDLGTLGGPVSAALRVTECAGGELTGDEESWRTNTWTPLRRVSAV